MANSTYAAKCDGAYVPVRWVEDENNNGRFDRGEPSHDWVANKTFRECMEVDSYATEEEKVSGESGGYDMPDEFLCPTDKVAKDPENAKWSEYNVLLSYGYNSTGWDLFAPSSGDYFGHRADSVRQSAEKLAFVDSIDWWVTWRTGAYVSPADYRYGWDVLGQANIWQYQMENYYGPTIYRHSEGANVLFYDGHVNKMKKEEIFVIADWEASPKRAGMWTSSGR
jgi:prepilin-type processing-associated H-X9-DG protein